MFWGKLQIDYGSFEVPGFEPDFVFKFEWGEGVSCTGGHDLAG